MSSIAVLSFPKAGPLRIHLGSMMLSVILLVTGVVVYGKVRRLAMSNEYRTFMESRRPLMNAIELKEWCYLPNEISPTEIRVRVVVHQPGRFAGNVVGTRTDSSDSFTKMFSSRPTDPRAKRQVTNGEAFTVRVPLEGPGGRGTLMTCALPWYSFKAPSGPATGDIAKVFMNSPQQTRRRRLFLRGAAARFSSRNRTEPASCR